MRLKSLRFVALLAVLATFGLGCAPTELPADGALADGALADGALADGALGDGAASVEIESETAPTRAVHERPGTTSAPDCYLGVVLSNHAVDVLAEVEGRVVEVLVEPGTRVEAGALLARLENRRLEHQLARERGTMRLIDAEVGSFSVQFEQAERQHQRRVSVDGLLSRQEIETSETAVEVARYRLEVAHAEVVQGGARIAELESELARLEIRAPFAGVVALRPAEPGMVLRAGSRVVRLLGDETSRLRFAVPPADAGALSAGSPLRVELESLGRTVAATVRHVAPEIDGPSEMLFVEADLDPVAATLPPGAIARVSRPLGETPRSCFAASPSPSLSVPDSSIAG